MNHKELQKVVESLTNHFFSLVEVKTCLKKKKNCCTKSVRMVSYQGVGMKHREGKYKEVQKQNREKKNIYIKSQLHLSTVAAAQIYRMFIVHHISGLNGKKRTFDKWQDIRRHKLRVIYKVPFRFNSVRNWRKINNKKESIFFVRNMLF